MKHMFCWVLLSFLLFSQKVNSIPAKRNMVSLFSTVRVRIQTLNSRVITRKRPFIILKDMLDIDYEEIFNLAIQSMEQMLREDPSNDAKTFSAVKKSYAV